MGPARSEADRLIDAAAAGRRLTAAELRLVLEHVAQAGFDPAQNSRAVGLAGMIWQGRALRGRDRITTAEAHYLDHVVKGNEWPPGTSYQDYLESISSTILDPESGVAFSRFRGRSQLGIIGRSGAYQGSEGFSWILVEYRIEIGHWVTAYQPAAGLATFYDANRSDFRWLRLPL